MDNKEKFTAQVPKLDLAEGADMLTDFSREAQRHLISARNSLLVLETIPSDQEAIENVFKTFHTIKGLADFLDLHDITCLTNEAETLLDQTRKELLSFEGKVVELTNKTIDSLQKLLELLDEQIANDGKLVSDYYDISDLISAIREVSSKKQSAVPQAKPVIQNLPTINYEPDMTACSQLEDKLKKGETDIKLSKELTQKLVSDFQETTRELKEAQSKLHERQRELIKERELAIKLTQQAQEETRAKSEYLANMSHEIRTLINAILGFTDLLRDGSLSAKQREHLDTIILSGKMLLGIVNDILDYSKVESGKLKLENIDFNLDHIVEEVFKIIRTRLLGKTINLYFDIDEGVPRSLLGDPTRLKQIFINLLDNAIKFTEEGQIGLDIKMAEGEKSIKGKEMIHFMVADTGIGIPSDRKDQVFESFTQAHLSTTRLYGGTGLGLALCKNFVENMGGKIWVESKLGEGSQFHFCIECNVGESAIETKRTALPDNFKKINIMVVDNDQQTINSISKICKNKKLNIIQTAPSAKTASEALLKLEADKKQLPAVIFISTAMPNKEGFMLAYKIREQDKYKSVKLIAVSTDVKLETSPEYANARFDSFIAKPIIHDELMEAVMNVLDITATHDRQISGEMLQKISCEGIRILVVEDSVPNQELLKVHFETLGCICDYASNGQEAIEALKKSKYDVCFMDLQMPVLNGVEAAKIIRNEMRLTLPIVALTAAEVEEEKDNCYKAGMNDYLAKPFDLDELKQKIIKSTKM